MLRVDASDDEDDVAVLLDGLKECAEVEVADDLRAMAIGGVEVIPDIFDTPYRQPVALRVANEPHLLAEVLLGIIFRISGFHLKTLFLKHFSQHLDREIAVQSDIIRFLLRKKITKKISP